MRIVMEALWTKFVGPVLLWPLLCHRGATPLWAAASGRGSQRSNSGVSAAAVNAAIAAAAGADGPTPVRRSQSSSTQLPSGDWARLLVSAP